MTSLNPRSVLGGVHVVHRASTVNIVASGVSVKRDLVLALILHMYMCMRMHMFFLLSIYKCRAWQPEPGHHDLVVLDRDSCAGARAGRLCGVPKLAVRAVACAFRLRSAAKRTSTCNKIK